MFPFENRGKVGVTLHHPHGQLYAYPFVPPLPARELALQAAHLQSTAAACSRRWWPPRSPVARALIYGGAHVAAFLPVCARYAFEVWIAPHRPAPSFPAPRPVRTRATSRAR